MQEVLEDLDKVATTDATVLIQGETGTGKELIARAIHSRSRRSDKPLVTLNCAAIPANLIESEFFGHEKGAFTGANEKRQGRFSHADGGTIFLDEIGELPLELQPKLLRVLQEGTFEPLGSAKTQKVDVRVVAATNRDLKKEADAGRFREDLYFRLNVFPLHIPPLRDRREDIPLLAQAFVERQARMMNRGCDSLAPDVIRRLAGYPWPGNVRELQNVITRALISGEGGALDLDRALPGTTPEATPSEPPVAGDSPTQRIWTIQELQELERGNIIRALESTNWRVSGNNGAARLLGMKPSTLSSRTKALGIQRPGSDISLGD
jgi:transcriptional regulator with GAF, ATPase, and Fis domain